MIKLIYRNNHPPFPLNCYVTCTPNKHIERTAPKLRLLLVFKSSCLGLKCCHNLSSQLMMINYKAEVITMNLRLPSRYV